MSALISPQARCKHKPNISCSECRLASLCLPISLNLEELEQVDDVIRRNQPLHKGDYLYRTEDDFTSIYAVRSGCIKTVRLSSRGEEQITGFYLPGEVLGMDGLDTNCHTNSAMALDTASICELPFNHLEQLSNRIPSMQRYVVRLMSREISSDQALITLLSKHTADERIAAFLLSLSSRYSQQKLSATEFIVPMSRTDMANYLGLTVETASRTFSKLQKSNIIKTEHRQITLLDVDKLKTISPS